MPKATRSASYHLLQSDPEVNEPPASITQDDEAAEDDEAANKSPLWKAGINLLCELNGAGIFALPYVIAQGGLLAVAMLVIVPFVAFYTGAILIDCLYDKNDTGERVRVRSNYKQLGEACSARFGGAISHTVQLLELFLMASLCLVLCTSLAYGIFPDSPLSDKVWTFITATAVLPTLFLKNLSRVAWLSLISAIAIFIAVVAVLVYGIAHHSSWNPGKILVWDIESVPVSLAIISYSYLCHTTLPGLEASMEDKSQFRTILGITYLFVAIIKVTFSVLTFFSFSSNIQEVISNSLPMGVIRTLVNAF